MFLHCDEPNGNYINFVYWFVPIHGGKYLIKQLGYTKVDHHHHTYKDAHQVLLFMAHIRFTFSFVMNTTIMEKENITTISP